jgi:ubiquinone/menaquinone biosynthesis C-methylase UbiE
MLALEQDDRTPTRREGVTARLTSQVPPSPIRWLGERGHGGDPELLRRQLELLAPIRDQVIAIAGVGSGKRVLDIGCGDGLIALAAAEAVGPTGQVICSDVSDQVLDRCRERAAERGVLEQCSFVKASAGDLSPIGDQAVDAVTVRSVLIYEPKKANAFAEFYRVLRPGGGCRCLNRSTVSGVTSRQTAGGATTSRRSPR